MKSFGESSPKAYKSQQNLNPPQKTYVGDRATFRRDPNLLGPRVPQLLPPVADIKFSPEVGRAFVQFIYTREVQEDLLKEHTLAFLALGDLYDMQELKDMAETKLLSQLVKENMVEMIFVGELFKADNIYEAALKMTKANMAWLRDQVRAHKTIKSQNVRNLDIQEGGVEELQKLSKDTLTRLI